MRFWPHKATEEPAEEPKPTPPVHYLDPVKPRPRRRKK